MAVVPKGNDQLAVARLGSPRVVANLGEIQAANSKMAEELEKVNSDLAQALKGLQEVQSHPALKPKKPLNPKNQVVMSRNCEDRA